MNRHIRTILTIVLLGGILTGLLSGCDKTDKELEEARLNVIPAEIVAQSLESVKNLGSYRTDIYVENIQSGETWTNIETIEFVYPDKIQTLGVSELNYPMIRIGTDEYFSMDREYWHYTESLIEYGLADNSPAYNLILECEELIGVEVLDDQEIEDTVCYRYTGRVDFEAALEAEIAALDTDNPDYDDLVKSIREQPRREHQYEVWIGKHDYLLYKLVDTQITTGDADTIDQSDKSVITWTFYDFNSDITIEPPAEDTILFVELTYDATGSIGGDDIEKQEIRYEITVRNTGTDTAENLRILINTEATNSGKLEIQASAEEGKVDLGPDQTVVFTAVWELNMTDLTKEEVSAMLDRNEVRAEWRAGFRSQTLTFE